MTGRRRLAWIAPAALAAACLAPPTSTSAVVGFPGSSWGNFYQEFSRPGVNEAILQGWIRQGVAWGRWQAGDVRFVLQTYGTFRYWWDGLADSWNNYLAPGAGVAVDFTAPNLPLATAGVEYVYQWSYRSGVSEPYWAPFLNWYHWWDIRENNWPGSTWGDLRWEIPDTGPTDLVLMGWVRQGVVIHRWRPDPLTFLLSPYLLFRYSLDTLGPDYNNYAGPGAGIAVDMDGVRGLQPSWAIEYAWEKNLRSQGGVQRLDLVLRWYTSWDLAKR
jgi:hypothetical protein